MSSPGVAGSQGERDAEAEEGKAGVQKCFKIRAEKAVIGKNMASL